MKYNSKHQKKIEEKNNSQRQRQQTKVRKAKTQVSVSKKKVKFKLKFGAIKNAKRPMQSLFDVSVYWPTISYAQHTLVGQNGGGFRGNRVGGYGYTRFRGVGGVVWSGSL